MNPTTTPTPSDSTIAASNSPRMAKRWQIEITYMDGTSKKFSPTLLSIAIRSISGLLHGKKAWIRLAPIEVPMQRQGKKNK